MSARNDKPAAPARPRPGRESLPRDEVDDIQRARILSAMVEVAAVQGYLGAAVAPVVARAGVSRRTFYELFDGREDCFLAAFDWGVEQARRVMVEAYSTGRSWRERARHALAALLVFLDSEPELARACVIEALGAGSLLLARRAEVLNELIVGLGADAPRARGAGEAPLLTAEGIIGGAFSVIHGRLIEQRIADVRRSGGGGDGAGAKPRTDTDGDAPGPLIELHGQLMALIALPYLGPGVAGEELTRPAPEVPMPEKAGVAGEGGRLLERLDMRLTYRTVRCLMFIGQNPGSSNREIAQGAEVPDEGQTSKLLGRLTRLGLIANTRPHGPGYPNYWTLTPHGEQVLGTVRGR
ncbi:MAG TPA: TetR/AcrR family transcriptional regulator [Solirubrobacteraceae bacterium]|jgi:AcrR family transcriptional regulator|nr:TetR/AcrR family transcriptional regulator [Solirubrobacteraceae bacterium]